MTVDHRFQSHLTELNNCSTYHSFKAKIVSDIYCFLLSNVFSAIDKANPVTFCIGTCHIINLFLRKCIQKLCHTFFIGRNILSIKIKIPKICKISIHNNICCKRKFRIYCLTDPLLHHILTVIIYIRSEDSFNRLCRRFFFIFKCSIYFQKKFCSNGKIPPFLLISIGYGASQLTVQKTESSAILPKFFCRISRIAIGCGIIFRKKFFI